MQSRRIQKIALNQGPSPFNRRRSYTFGSALRIRATVFCFVALTATSTWPTTVTAEPQNTVQPNSVDPILRATPLDASRSRPLEPSPAVAPRPGFTIFLVHAREHGKPILEFAIPPEYVRTTPTGIVDGLGLYFFAFYPDMHGPAFPGNQSQAWCGISCKNEMMIEILNAGRSYNNLSEDSYLGRYAGELKDKPKLFDRAFSTVIGNDRIRLVHNYYERHSPDGKIEALVICTPETPNPLCEEFFPSSLNNLIHIHYTFSMKYLEQWNLVHNQVEALLRNIFVTSLPPTEKGGE